MKKAIVSKLGLVLAVIFMAAMGAMSFKKAEKTEAKVATVYEYDSNSIVEGDFADPAKWKVASGTPTCYSSGTRPCSIAVPDGSTLGAQIAGKSNEQILNLPHMKRKP